MQSKLACRLFRAAIRIRFSSGKKVKRGRRNTDISPVESVFHVTSIKELGCNVDFTNNLCVWN